MDRLAKFVEAQAPVYAAVTAELGAGRKRTHWMWFVFPQLSGLGRSDMAERFAIASLADARAYLAHPVLGRRLRECTALVNAVGGPSVGGPSVDGPSVGGPSAHDIFGSPDDLKFHSSMTLFHRAAPDEALFTAALAKYFAGREDALTVNLLKGQGDG